MDLMLNTIFTSPLLGRVPLPGFFDNFNRAGGDPIGVTSRESRPWRSSELNGGVPNWLIDAAGYAYLSSSPGGHNSTVVDGLASSGTLSAKIARTTSQNRGGLVFRQKDIGNGYFIYQPGATAGVGLFKWKAGVSITLGTSSTLLALNDVLSVTFSPDGGMVVKVNGATVITANDTDFLQYTDHGLYCNSNSAAFGLDDATFIPS